MYLRNDFKCPICGNNRTSPAHKKQSKRCSAMAKQRGDKDRELNPESYEKPARQYFPDSSPYTYVNGKKVRVST